MCRGRFRRLSRCLRDDGVTLGGFGGCLRP
jgi:hypothetical protein